MSHGHDRPVPDVQIGRWPEIVVVILLAVTGLIAAVSIANWWPDGTRVASLQNLIPYTANGVEIVKGQMVTVTTACSGASADPDSGIVTGSSSAVDCGDSEVAVLSGTFAHTTQRIQLTQDIIATGISPGDPVYLLDTSGAGGDPSSALSFFRADRDVSLWWLLGIFVVVVLLVGWLRGLMSILSLGFAGLVVVGYLIPALMSGRPAVPVTAASAVLILTVMLFTTHGISMRTSVALLGGFVGVWVSTLAAVFSVSGTRLAGLGDENAGLLVFNVNWIDVQQLVMASVVLAGLGTLNDVTVTQVSALWELRATAPGMSQWDLLRSALRIGRDHIASSV